MCEMGLLVLLAATIWSSYERHLLGVERRSKYDLTSLGVVILINKQFQEK